MTVTIINTPFTEQLEHPFQYELDHFQKHAVNIINTEPLHNILVTCATGSGKSVVAEYSILKGIELGKKVIYCSPIKTLSNQKFYEFTHKKLYEGISIGIITGDNKFNPDAQVLIMTTEILLIMLSKRNNISDLDFNIDISKEVYSVIFDEVHYINDPDRGHVWEKSIMTMPTNVNMIMLSATIEKPKTFLNWVNNCNDNPTFLLSNEKRVVPLHFSYMLKTKYQFLGLNQKNPNKFLEMSGAKDYMNNLNKLFDTNDMLVKDTTIDKFLSFYNYFQENKVNKVWLINETCIFLEKNQMCPVIFFVFSKKGCISLANSIQKSYNTYDESIAVEKDFNYYLSKLEHKKEYLDTPQYHDLLKLAKKGIAVHHSGLIPVYKEIIELLYSKQLIKILFATETFSVGLNMPTKTVIFTDIFKYTLDGLRILHSHEFIQMSGRAGRRGLDLIGNVILLPQLFRDNLDKISLKNLLTGKSQTIESKLVIDTNIILSSINNSKQPKEFMNRSLLNTEFMQQLKGLKEISYNKETFNLTFDGVTLDEYNELLLKLKQNPRQNQMKKLVNQIIKIESDPNFSKYSEYKLQLKQIDSLKNQKVYLENYVDDNINEHLEYLQINGFLNENLELTLKGEISLVFRELNNLIGTNIVYNEYINSLTEIELLCLLVLLTKGKEGDTPKSIHKIIHFVEEKLTVENLNKEFVYPVIDWYNKKSISKIVTDSKIFEGDLVKVINRIVAFIDELIVAYTLNNNLNIIVTLNNIKQKIERDITVSESLYLKI